MNNTALSTTAGCISVIICSFCWATYRQERRAERSHEASIKEAALPSMFMLASTALEYVAVVSNYS